VESDPATVVTSVDQRTQFDRVVAPDPDTAEPRRIGTLERYLVATIVAAVVVVVHSWVHRQVGPHFDPVFLVAVGFSAWYGGLGPGLTTLVAAGLGAYLLTHGRSPTQTSSVAFQVAAYGFSGVVLTWLISSVVGHRWRVQRGAARTSRLHALNLSLAPALTALDVAPLILRHAMEALQARAGTIVLTDPAGGMLPPLRSPDEPGAPEPSPALTEALRTATPVFIETAADWRSRYGSAGHDPPPAGSVIALPFVALGEPAGVLELAFAHERRFTPEDRSFILTLAGQGAQALERARLYESERTARRHAETAREQVAFLAQVSEVLASSLDFRATVAAAARLAVPRLADFCAVDMVDASGRLRRLAVAHSDPDKEHAVWAMSLRYREVSDDPVPEVIRTAEAQIVPEISDELLRRFSRDEEHLAGMRAFGLRSLMIVPLRARGRILGAITYVTAESGRRYSPADLGFGEELARRVAIAVDNARLYRESDQALQEKNRTLALLDTVFRGAPIGLAFVDREFRFVRVNDALATLSGGTPDAYLGRTVHQVLGPQASLVAPYLAEVIATARPVLDRELVMSPAVPGATPRTFVSSYYPVGIAPGEVEWVGAIVLEVTERRRAEELLVQAQRMEAIAKVAGGVAHEVNNMMTVITGFTGFLEGAFLSGDARAEDVAEIRRAAERAAGITRQLLAYSRQQMLRPAPLDLNELIGQLVPVFTRLLGEGVTVDLHGEAELPAVEADRPQFEQVLVNLVLNARDAMSGEGTLTVHTDTVTAPSADYSADAGASPAPGRYVRVTVSDTGHGMDAATRDRVFEPFFTTKAAGLGSGLGLATVYGVVKQSGGDIRVSSEPGRGTTFQIFLPEFTGRAPARSSPMESAPSPHGAETILLVEDEGAVRRMASRALSGHGYTILEAENGAEALTILDRAPAPVHLVLTDVVMPVLGGRELGERLAVEHPGIRVLFMSGYTDDDITRRGMLQPGVPFLQKPFEPAELARKVREVLDR
jgi:two-component system cell cycle sensor histidine kinase/response regulator CckA